MTRKTKNSLVLFIVLVLIVAGGVFYGFVIQERTITARKAERKKLVDFNSRYVFENLQQQLDSLNLEYKKMDSVLAARPFNIPEMVAQSKFFSFVNDQTRGFSEFSYVDMKFDKFESEKPFLVMTYKLMGTAYFSEVYRLIYSIEHSKELKKVTAGMFTNNTFVEEDGTPNFLVAFEFDVKVYMSNNNQFASSASVENDLTSAPVHDIFYPLIRTQLPPNIDELLDVQDARLLALVPEGAFISDARGNSFLLAEGDPVYLGYLTSVDFDQGTVSFILNKGGIIEKITLEIEKEKTSRKKK